MIKHTQAIRLSVFEHFLWLTLKGLKVWITNNIGSTHQSGNNQQTWNKSEKLVLIFWVPFVRFINVKNTHAGVLLLVNLQASVCSFTKSKTLRFFTFFKLNKCYQIAESSITFYDIESF